MSAASRDSIVHGLVAIIENELPIERSSERVRADANLSHDLGLDSILILDLIGAAEERFGFEFEESDLEEASFESIDSLADVILKRIG